MAVRRQDAELADGRKGEGRGCCGGCFWHACRHGTLEADAPGRQQAPYKAGMQRAAAAASAGKAQGDEVLRGCMRGRPARPRTRCVCAPQPCRGAARVAQRAASPYRLCAVQALFDDGRDGLDLGAQFLLYLVAAAGGRTEKVLEQHTRQQGPRDCQATLNDDMAPGARSRLAQQQTPTG